MNLSEFTDGTTTTKPWLTIVAASLNAGSLAINGNAVVAGNAITLGSAGGVSLVADGAGPILETKGLTAGTGITLTPGASDVKIDADVTSLASAGGTTLVSDGAGPALAVKGLSSLGSITLTANANDVQLDLANAGPFMELDGSTPMLGALQLDTGNIAAGCQYSMTPGSGPIVTNTAVETTMLGITARGSTTIPANVHADGSAVHFSGSAFMAGGIALSTCTFNLNLNGASVWSNVFNSAGAVNQFLKFDIDLTSDGAAAGGAGLFTSSGVASVIGGVGGAWDVTVAQVFNLTATWNTADPGNQVQLGYLTASALY